MKVVVFTAVIGATPDCVRVPGFISPSVRYVCLSDRRSSPFPYRHVPVTVPSGLSAQLYARQLKILADHPALEGADVLLWHDAAFRLTMDPARHHVSWDGTPVSLTVTEFLILEALAQRPGIIKSRNQLMDAAYPDDVFVDDRTVDSHIKRLRRKFRAADHEFGGIETLYGAGYSFTDG